MVTDTALDIRKADESDAHVIGTLAHAVWPGTYGNILSQAQIRYMLDLLYDENALRQQMDQGQVFLLALMNAETVGFASYGRDHRSGAFKIHKLYVHPLVQGKGIGRKLLDYVLSELKNLGATAARLNVNRYNPARDFYECNGFVIVGEEDIAIGEGYFMNDFVMEKQI